MQEMPVSLKEYHSLVLWINFIVYLSYFLIKYVVAPILWFVLEWTDRKKDEPTCLGKFARITQIMQSVILLIFGKQLAIKQYVDERDLNKVSTMTLRRRRLSYGATMVLFVLIATFGVLAVGSALDLTLLSVTHICSEDPAIDCYPQLIRGANDSILNMSIPINEPIQDCSYWNSEGVSDKITFVCYQFVFNVELFLAVIGGLLAFFIYAMKTAIAVLLFLSVCCLGGCEEESKAESGCRRCLCVNRITVAIIVSGIEIVLAILCLVFGATSTTVDGINDSPELIFVATHASEVLVVFGIIATLLWLPWEDYTKAQRERNRKGGEEYKMDRK